MLLVFLLTASSFLMIFSIPVPASAATTRTFTTDQAASVVLGKPDFTSSGCYQGTTGLCTPQAITMNSKGEAWVADQGNARNLGYTQPFKNGEAATLYEGTSSMTYVPAPSGCSTTLSKQPSGIAFDSHGNLWVADQACHRILEYSAASLSTPGAAAVMILGKSSYTTSTGGTSQTQLQYPAGIAFDSHGNLWVADNGNNRVLEFAAGSLKTPGAAASVVLGQTGFSTAASSSSDTGMSQPTAVAFDSHGNLWVADSGNSRILEFSASSLKTSGAAASAVIGQTGFGTNTEATTAQGLDRPAGLAFDASGNLWVADTSNSRVLEYNAPLVTHEAASVVIGQSNMVSSNSGTSPTLLSYPNGLAFDSRGNLWVADSSNGRVLEFVGTASTGGPLPKYPAIPKGSIPTNFQFSTQGGTAMAGTFVKMLGPGKAVYNIPSLNTAQLNQEIANGDYSNFPQTMTYCTTTVNGHQEIHVSGFTGISWGGSGTTSTEVVLSGYVSYYTSASGWPAEPACAT